MKKYFLVFIFSLFLFNVDVFAYYKAPVDITNLSISELKEALDLGYLNSETLVNLYLDRIDAYDEMYNSINQFNPQALEEAKKLDKEREDGKIRGRLHGIPILVKCNIDVVGIPTTGGTKALADNYPLSNATVVQKLIDEGAIILGSTNMSELAFSASNSYSSYGYVRNVFDPLYTPYGSSGGSAVAVGAAFAAAALGTDTNSSVRLPASGAGLVGIRPTLGSVSRSGVIPYDIERDTVGVLSRNVLDNMLLFDIISGKDEKDEYTIQYDKEDIKIELKNLDGINIGVPTEYVKGDSSKSGVFGETDTEIYDLLVKSIEKLEKEGANIIYLDDFVKEENIDIATSTYAGITMCDNFNEYIKGTTGTIRSFEELADSKLHVQRLSGYKKGCNGEYKSKESRDKKKSKYRLYVDSVFEEYDLDIILYPTLKNRVFKYNKTGNISPGSSLGSVIGYPSITVPMGTISDGFSYNIEFFSLKNRENILYNIASIYEEINGNDLSIPTLVPALYEIPETVTELKRLYEDVVKMNSDIGEVKEWLNECRMFFKNYNSYEDVDGIALDLINKYEDSSIVNIHEEFIAYPNLLKVFTIVALFLFLVFAFINRVKKII